MYLQESDLAAFLAQCVNRLLDSAGNRTHGNDDVRCFRIAIIVEQLIMTSCDFIDFVENSLHTKVRFHGNRTVSTVAVVGGSGGDFIDGVLDKVDAVITGEIKHHEWLAVQNCDPIVVEAGHFATEHPVVDALADRLKTLDVKVVTATEQQPYVVK